jgi:hypothetical protein
VGLSDFVGGIRDSISSGVDDVTQAASSAAQSVEQTASNAAEAVEDTASSAASTVEQAASSAVDTAKQDVQSAAQWAGHQYDSAATYLQNKLSAGAPDDSQTSDVQGAGGDWGADRKLGEQQQVDLSSHDKVGQFLNDWGQDDDLGDTKTDRVRCQSNTAIAGMLMNGGPAELEKGLRAAADRADANAKAAPAGSDQQKQLTDAAARLRDAADAAHNNTLTPEKLDRASDGLFKTFADPNDINWKDGSPNKGVGGMGGGQIRDMEKTLGLTGGEAPDHIGSKSEWNPLNWAKSNKEETSENVWKFIPPGTSAHVGVFSDGERTATNAGPHGEPLRESDQAGYMEYDDSKTGTTMLVPKENTKDDHANHAVLFGREKDGTRYIYNSEGNPRFVSESADKKKFDQLSEHLMPRKSGTKDDAQTDVTHYS